MRKRITSIKRYSQAEGEAGRSSPPDPPERGEEMLNKEIFLSLEKKSERFNAKIYTP
jgi:hypothetical protein